MISQYMQSENSSNGCSRVNSETQYAYSHYTVIGNWLENSGSTEVNEYAISLMEELISANEKMV